MIIHSNVCHTSLCYFRGVTIVPTYSLRISKYTRWTGEVAQQLECLLYKQATGLDPQNSQLGSDGSLPAFPASGRNSWLVKLVSSGSTELGRQSLPQTE